MPRLLRRRLRCHYCNQDSANNQQGVPRTWVCPHCDSTNHLDERGELTDPPADLPAARPVRYAHSRPRAIEPELTDPDANLFCVNCLANQNLILHMMSEYIPDESDSQYKDYANTAAEYRRELERRYPEVCENCLPRVQRQLRRRNRGAQAEQFRRILDNSRRNLPLLGTRRHIWTLRILFFAKWAYIYSVLVGILWHTLGIIVVPEETVGEQAIPDARTCLLQALETQQVPNPCFDADWMIRLVSFAILADFFTLWWNPKLQQKTIRPGGRMRNLYPLWIARISVLAVRFVGFSQWVDIAQIGKEALPIFYVGHGAMIFALLICVYLSWYIVRIEYRITSAFIAPTDLPMTPPRAPSGQGGHITVRPRPTPFDTMGDSFTKSIFGTCDDSAAFPPSPTLASSSTSSSIGNESGTAAATPRNHKRSAIPALDDRMDWTPTQGRFSKTPVEIIPPAFSTHSTAQAPPPPQPHSIFMQPSSNPFHHRVPAAPVRADRVGRSPWSAGIWHQTPPETQKTFLNEIMRKGQASPGERERVRTATPRDVVRSNQLFAKPQLQYDWQGYTGEKSTGLEDRFGALFGDGTDEEEEREGGVEDI
ncbi:hypothetical protein CC78DRAFT_614829 [Lojkania enalia]|uniref:Ima1 N-terminal domain-containing protein n=1 Tax=Lojkania enalia TaxID=147567 RepID=A0A9P4KDI8_9PLEO|nr:hypothetical protein CC78DRAFT_614829 [Didymosphaeria enalia]